MALASIDSLRQALAAGTVRLVDEQGQFVGFEACFARRCWAHLRDAADGRTYVQELRGSQELLQPRYQELLGLAV